MKSLVYICLLATLFGHSNAVLGFIKKKVANKTEEFHIRATVKIYSNLAEVIVPLSNPPIEFNANDWNDIRSDSVTLVGPNVTILTQTITEKKKSFDNTEVFVRSPVSSKGETSFVKATLLDEKRNLVKLVEKDISKEPVYFTVSSNDILYLVEPPESKFYVNFTYTTSDEVYLSYLRSNLNWKTRYQLNLFENPKPADLTSMADIRNDGASPVDIEYAELLGGDINLQATHYHRKSYGRENVYDAVSYGAAMAPPGQGAGSAQVAINRAEEVAGLYVYTIDKPFSIDAKTNYLLPMFKPRVTVDRFALFSKHFYGNAGSSVAKAQRSYRLQSDRFLSSGNCILRESDRLVGETSLPDIAAKDKYVFSIGDDADLIVKENITLVSSTSYNETIRRSSYGGIQTRTTSVYQVEAVFKNFKKNRDVNVEYQQQINGISVKLNKPNAFFTQDGSQIKAAFKLPADEEKTFSYKFEVVN